MDIFFFLQTSDSESVGVLIVPNWRKKTIKSFNLKKHYKLIKFNIYFVGIFSQNTFHLNQNLIFEVDIRNRDVAVQRIQCAFLGTGYYIYDT